MFWCWSRVEACTRLLVPLDCRAGGGITFIPTRTYPRPMCSLMVVESFSLQISKLLAAFFARQYHPMRVSLSRGTFRGNFRPKMLHFVDILMGNEELLTEKILNFFQPPKSP